MATATTNILINSISGRIGNVVFYTRRGRQCVRAHVIPRNPDTEAQRAVRKSFGDAVRSWQSMSTDEQYSYTRKARHLNMSGYNLYISICISSKFQVESSMEKKNSPQFHSSGTWNSLPVPELAEGFPSVSESHMLLSGTNTRPDSLNPGPG